METDNKNFLYEKINTLMEFLAKEKSKEIPEIIKNGLSSKIKLREYQKQAFLNYIFYFDKFKDNNNSIHTLFHMATGSGKTVIMAGLILYLYTKGYRKFLFFVNQTNVLEKTIGNFINSSSDKFLFKEVIEYEQKRIKIDKVDSFSENDNNIEIIFTTIQKLHKDLNSPKENSLTFDDFLNKKIVFISDESHHINSLTKKPTKSESELESSWEMSVINAFKQNRENVMLEFTATCDLKDKNVLEKYKNKIVFNYPLSSFRESKYTKDFQNFATNSDLWSRTLIALIMSEYRKFLFAELKLNIKPVVMLKSQRILDSEKFYNIFFKQLVLIEPQEIRALKDTNIEILKSAIDYFEQRNDNLNSLINSLKNSFAQDNAIIMNNTSDNSIEKQLLLNSLEDEKNPIRIIFTVDMLNEGWDVLNLFDIVRLYDTRQGGDKSARKISNYTIKEAQLIGRGARYCPFDIGDPNTIFKRKYDNDLDNKYRILETMFFHSKNDSKYINELKKALIYIGLQDMNTIVREYKLKEEFKKSDFYRKGIIFSNQRISEDLSETGIDSEIKKEEIYYISQTINGNVTNLFDDDEIKLENEQVTSFYFNSINLNILLGAIDCFEQLKFNVLKNKFSKLSSKEEFLISNKYLGDIKINIKHKRDKLSTKIIYEAVKFALSKISSYITEIKPKYKGTKKFIPNKICNILRNKKINFNNISSNSGYGVSQNQSIDENLQLNLKTEDWYVYEDNYGTDQEKAFIKKFVENIKCELDKKQLNYYVIRNERIPELAIYTFDSGERIEPDFILFVMKKNEEYYQCYVEPKGEHLMEKDKWKETFLLSLNEFYEVDKEYEKYKILGFPFFNTDKNKFEKFQKEVINLLNKIKNIE
ncbi:DEAD/DEAH box helicase family protein [Metamycoplasma hyosynoviae]|uniref:DEAD/DEAH box helicase family protein n=1 Tax=Metamycoplasma hyosynoviae TaxID=29559 RepID=UPI00055D32CF|nr:DEAD/DEAH box helicase family protein [Metamycoplasma hyosynoviae]